MMMAGVAKDRMAPSVKKRSSVSSLSGHEFRQKELHGYTKNSRSTVSYMDEPSQRDDASRLTVQMENTYQLALYSTLRRIKSDRAYHFTGEKGRNALAVVRGIRSRGDPEYCPTKHFPVVIVNQILKDVLTNYLREEQYEPELCRQMAKTISEVIKTQVKDLMIPRYKLIVVVHIGQLKSQSILIGSRCLWDPKSDTFSSYVFRNSSLSALASVYAVYFE